MKPVEDFLIFINFKTYPQGTGQLAVKLAKACEEAGKESGYKIIPVVQAVDLYRLVHEVKIPLWVQNIDAPPPGRYTGWTNLETVMEAGAKGTLVNHSERPIPLGTIKQILARTGKFAVMVCGKTLGQIENLVKLKPSFIAYEVSGLIGSKVSIIEGHQKAVKHAVEICKTIPLIVGAGIHRAEDLKTAKALGARGVLISSAIVLADNPKEKLLLLLK